MKFLRESHNFWLLLIVVSLSACAQRQHMGRATIASESKQASFERPKGEEELMSLQRQEKDSPHDEKLKLLLGNVYWCRHNPAFAVEHWRWIVRHASEGVTHSRALELLKWVEQKQESKISAALCP